MQKSSGHTLSSCGSMVLTLALACSLKRGEPSRQIAKTYRSPVNRIFSAERYLLDGDTNKTCEYFRGSVATGVVKFIEYGMAQRQLAAIGPR